VARKTTRKPRSLRPARKSGHQEVKLSGLRIMYLQVENAFGEIERIALTVPSDITSTRVIVSYTEGVDVSFSESSF